MIPYLTLISFVKVFKKYTCGLVLLILTHVICRLLKIFVNQNLTSFRKYIALKITSKVEDSKHRVLGSPLRPYILPRRNICIEPTTN